MDLLKTTGDKPLLDALREGIQGARTVEMAVAYLSAGGLDLIRAELAALLARGGSLRVIAGANPSATDPEALGQLLDLQTRHPGQVGLWTMEPPSQGGIFHVKAYLFHDISGPRTGLVGSANLTFGGLARNREWTVQLDRAHALETLMQLHHSIISLMHDPQAVAVDEAWLDAYRQRVQEHRARYPRPPAGKTELPPDSTLPLDDHDDDHDNEARDGEPRGDGTDEGTPPDDAGHHEGGDPEPDPPRPGAPEPHEVQREALAALAQSRAEGKAAALVVMATGLGKTWLAAFDVVAARARRVLFVAHREEILQQAHDTFKVILPDASMGFFTGKEKEVDKRVTFASVQTLGKTHHHRQFDEAHFDYIIVDEFHHAAARTYRKIIDHFEPEFLLGLTATPMRRDGKDLLALCGDHVAYRCPLQDGIARDLLSPLRYFGVPDDIDYKEIRFTNGRFDTEQLEDRAIASSARATMALDAIREHGSRRTLAFCVTTRHADAMARYFRDQGLEARAVHSGPTSDDRADSLRAFQDGEVRVLCAVDMFNEGLDIPLIDMVLMLRPTESPVIWLQQLGRGLRKAPDKPCLTVLDFIGNHKVFLDRPSLLLADFGAQDRDERLEHIARVFAQTAAPPGFVAQMPPGIDVHFDPILLDRFLEELKQAERFEVEQLIRAGARIPDPDGGPSIGTELKREDIAAAFDLQFSNFYWQQGYVVSDKEVFLFVTLDKSNLADEHHYRDHFLSRRRFQWQSQNRTSQDSSAGNIISRHKDLGYRIHLWIRPNTKVGSISTPFVYCGQVDFESWTGNRPITVVWTLRAELPDPIMAYLDPSQLTTDS